MIDRLRCTSKDFKSLFFLVMLVYFYGSQPLKAKCDDPAVTSTARKIIVRFQHERWIGQDISAYAWQDQIYMPVLLLFNQLSINIEYDREEAQLRGFFLNPDHPYTIDLKALTAIRDTARYQFGNRAFFRKKSDVYLDIRLLNRIFKLGLKYEVRTMKVRMHNDYEFPAEVHKRRRAIQQNRMHRFRLNTYAGKQITVQPSVSNIFTPGLTNWRLRNSGTKSSRYHAFDIEQMGYILGGDYRVQTGWALSGTANSYLEGQWRWIRPEKRTFRQVTLGTALRSAHNPVQPLQFDGLRLTNKEPVVTEPFMNYEFTEVIPDQHDVEVYRNRQLIDFMTFEDSVLVNFGIPVGYGSQTVGLKIYGPHGEYRRMKQYLQISPKMISNGEWQYHFMAGRLHVRQANVYKSGWGGNLSGGYGISDVWTLRGGTAVFGSRHTWDGYLESIWNSNKHHFTGYISTNLHWGASWNYRQYGKWRYSIGYRKLNEAKSGFSNPAQTRRGQWSITANRKWTYRTIGANTYLRFHQNRYHHLKWGSIRFGTRVRWRGISVRLEPRFTYRSQLYTILQSRWELLSALRFQMFNRWHVHIQSRFDRIGRNMHELRLQVHRRINRYWQVSISGRKFDNRNTWTGSTIIRLNLPFVKQHVRLQKSAHQWYMDQQLKGSLWYDPLARKLQANNRGWDEHGLVQFNPFHDVDFDGVKDRGEQWVERNKIYVRNSDDASAGGNTDNKRYRSYVPQKVCIQTRTFSNMQVPKSYENVMFSPYPNIINQIPIPLIRSGNISGRVEMKTARKVKSSYISKRMWRLILYNSAGESIDTVRTLPSGRFYIQGVPVGRYSLVVDSVQLRKLNRTVFPSEYNITIGAKRSDRYVGSLIYTLRAESDITSRKEFLNWID